MDGSLLREKLPTIVIVTTACGSEPEFADEALLTLSCESILEVQMMFPHAEAECSAHTHVYSAARCFLHSHLGENRTHLARKNTTEVYSGHSLVLSINAQSHFQAMQVQSMGPI